MNASILRTLEEQVKPEHAVLLVVDPQKDFCASDGAMARNLGLDLSRIQATIPTLNELIDTARQVGVRVVWIREVFSESRMLESIKVVHGEGDDLWLITEGGDGVDWYAGVTKPLPGEAVVTKWHYDAFEDTDLHLMLQSMGVRTLLMTGFSTNVCVESTARHGFIKGYHIVLISDCTNCVVAAEHEATVVVIGKYFGKVATSAQLAAIWDI